ncbi:MAG: SHOCT domain-containing protein [Syntrophomonadaceae bacterium]|nr:SHOCT domain-containing protein [Syntrophomonadaceae bacterium]
MHPYYGPGVQFWGQENAWWMWLASMLMYLLFWGVVSIIAIRMFRKYCVKAQYPTVKGDRAMSILIERYARGEIDSEEFKRIKADL